LSAQKKLLIVDDEKHIRAIFLKVLSLMAPDVKVDIAVNGAEAVDAFREGRHDVLVMDLHMPVKDGFSAFKDIKAICENEHINMPAVIFCSGYQPPEELAEIIAREPRHCMLTKPVLVDTLMKEINSRL